MSVVIKGVSAHSPAYKVGIKKNDVLVSINGEDIIDVLDYRFYQNDTKLSLKLLSKSGEEKNIVIEKDEFEELGLEFETYLMDKQHSCKNKCIFCFIDQMPPNMRESLYFKDDDSRMSFLFGNYITLTNITEHEVERIIKMHISPINVSVHTTNPDLRCKMMNNRFAGKSLEVLWRLLGEGIKVNTQLVLCPGINDGDELRRSLSDLLEWESLNSISCVPVGITGYRDGLTPLRSFTKAEAENVINIIDEFAKNDKLSAERRVFAGDEFYIMAEKQMPSASEYGDFEQLENGVGICALVTSEADDALEYIDPPTKKRNISIATGVAAYPFITNIVDKAAAKWHNLDCKVFAIKNEFFGGEITVSGLVTGQDIIKQLKSEKLGDELLIPSVMLRHEGDLFLDDTSIKDIEKVLKVKVRVVTASSGDALISALADK